METISRLQKHLDDSKFFEAQKEAELLLLQQDLTNRRSLLQLYFAALKAQSKTLPPDLLVEYVEIISLTEPEHAAELLSELSSNTVDKFQRRILIQKILMSEVRGLTSEMYQHISALQLHAYARKIPSLPPIVVEVSEKYFSGDFALGLQRLSLFLLKGDVQNSEQLVKQLIFSSIERSTPKGTREKLLSISEILNALQNYSLLEVYKNLCLLLADTVREKQDFKRLTEIVIYADSFKLQVLVLSILDRDVPEVARDYAKIVRANREYSFVYFDKYFPQLKKYFVSMATTDILKDTSSVLVKEAPDFGKSSEPSGADQVFDFTDEDVMVAHLIRHGSFEDAQLLDLSVGFLQSEFPRAAASAAEIVLQGEGSDETRLKASYLKLTSHLMLKDYRQAVDLAFEALKLAKTQNDILSFLYAKAEAHLALKEVRAARATFKEIVALDADYRLAREKLERLNEV